MTKENLRSGFVFLATSLSCSVFFFTFGLSIVSFLFAMIFAHGAQDFIKAFSRSKVPGKIYRGITVTLAFIVSVVWIFGVLSIVSAQIAWRHIKYGAVYTFLALGVIAEMTIYVLHASVEYLLLRHSRATYFVAEKLDKLRADLKK